MLACIGSCCLYGNVKLYDFILSSCIFSWWFWFILKLCWQIEECFVCSDKKANVLFKPYNHLCVCSGECIYSYIKTYDSYWILLYFLSNLVAWQEACTVFSIITPNFSTSPYFQKIISILTLQLFSFSWVTKAVLPQLSRWISRKFPCFQQIFLVKITFFPWYFLEPGLRFTHLKNEKLNLLCHSSQNNVLQYSKALLYQHTKDTVWERG